MLDLVTKSTRVSLALVSWLSCALVVGSAYQQLVGPVRADDTLAMHARFEEVLARQDVER